MNNEFTVYIIDDDAEIRAALAWLFDSIAINVKTFDQAKTFIKDFDPNSRGCIMLDIRMAEMSGFEVLELLKSKNNRLPIVMMTAHGDIPMAVRAMKNGATDFLCKPFNNEYLLELIQKFLGEPYNTFSKEDEVKPSFDQLTSREREILGLIVIGKLNKQISFELGIAISTVETHRARIMKKLNAANLAQLIKLYLQYQAQE